MLLGGPWGPKRFKANQPEKLEKQWKTDDAKNSPNHYTQKLKRISDNRETRQSRLANGFPGRFLEAFSSPSIGERNGFWSSQEAVSIIGRSARRAIRGGPPPPNKEYLLLIYVIYYIIYMLICYKDKLLGI